MPFNGSGTFTRGYSWVTDAGTPLPIDASRMDADTNDIASGLSNAVTRDGQGAFAADVNANNFRLKNLNPGTAMLPSLYGQGAASTGFYFPSATAIGVAVGGVQQGTFDSAANLKMGGAVTYSGGAVVPTLGVYSPGANILSLATNGFEALRADANSNIGIGAAATAISTYRVLNVTGPNTSTGGLVEVALSDRSQIGRLAIASGGLTIENTGASTMALVNNGGIRLQVDGTGNVGIAKTPTARLDVTTAGVNVANFDSSAANGGYIQVSRSGVQAGFIGSGIPLAGGGAAVSDFAVRSEAALLLTYNGGVVGLKITAAGILQDINANELGFKGLPNASVTTGAFAASDRGKCIFATGGVTVPNATMAAGDIVVIQETTGAAQTITASITTLRQTGTANTGNRTLKAYGRCSILFQSGALGFISGDVT